MCRRGDDEIGFAVGIEIGGHEPALAARKKPFHKFDGFRVPRERRKAHGTETLALIAALAAREAFPCRSGSRRQSRRGRRSGGRGRDIRGRAARRCRRIDIVAGAGRLRTASGKHGCGQEQRDKAATVRCMRNDLAVQRDLAKAPVSRFDIRHSSSPHILTAG
ncbi:hypothetical protein [Sphingopyxis sp. DBS4]|uniref:hypothetical protein n=1 Tax=Sphingopyxis sp. DBS4 TaxID=2968500 RepID=UPI00214CE522|nr:hypothetical protein [Sphingopyxis sp. DBS4]